MFAHAAAIQPELRHLVGAFEFQENPLFAQVRGELEMLAIPSDAAEITRNFIATIVSVPGVRQVDHLPPGIVVPGLMSTEESRFDRCPSGSVTIKGTQISAPVLLPAE